MRIRKFVCAAVLAAFTCVSVGGCYGKYALFNSAHKFGGNLGGKYVGAVVNLVFWVVGVYGICLFADLLIFNTIEFWTGSNPVAMNSDIYQETDADGNKVYAVRNTDGSLSVSMTDVKGNKADFTLERDGNIIRAIDAKGEVIAQQIVNNEGEMVAQVASR
ncbi:MAG: DUF3332 domain-containing protein [Chitinispirillales bacterium]|jgi:hypothetical protein|nr:DUF3332 domain-containing protein [Chitinispirillales bacterium]